MVVSTVGEKEKKIIISPAKNSLKTRLCRKETFFLQPHVQQYCVELSFVFIYVSCLSYCLFLYYTTQHFNEDAPCKQKKDKNKY